MAVVPVIVSGGAGARLWPVSRETHPKPLIRLTDGRSLIQHAFLRAAALPDAAEIMTVTGQSQLWTTEAEFQGDGMPKVRHSIVLEPEGRDTAAAVAVATLAVEAAHGGEAVLAVFPADHMIERLPAFVEAAGRAIELARQGRLVTFGIRPDGAETAYGYIEADGEDVIRFVEKPNRERAEQYVASGRFYWNSGMFCFRADTMIALMDQHCPDILAQCRASLAASRRTETETGARLDLDPASFGKVRKISLDYAVLEKASGIAVVPCEIGWTDIGSWNAYADLLPADGAGNSIIGAILAEDTSGSMISSSGRLVAAVGLRDVIIVDTADALLVADKAKAQSVKNIYERLKAEGHEAHSTHRTVERPWGSYTILDEGPRFKVKRIEVKPGGRLSLQSHRHRSEHWVVVAGTAKVVNGETEQLLQPNQSTYIPCGAKHRLENPGTERVALIEVQTGDYLGEDDIVRYEDVYGRS